MIEILIAVTFLALCASIVLDTVVTANTQAGYALRRARVMSALQDAIETLRGTGATTTLTIGTTPSTVTLPGFVGSVTMSQAITKLSTSRTIYFVTVTATWTEESSLGTRTDTASLTTVIKNG